MAPVSSAHLTCLCGAISAPGSLLSDPEIPLSIEICHCNPCRYTTGSLGASFPQLKSSPPQNLLSQLTAYHSSSTVTRYFCSTCGCHCFAQSHQIDQWYCLSGIIEPSTTNTISTSAWPKDTIHISQHSYILDTIDGSLTPFLLNLNNRTIPTWSAAPGSSEFDLSHSTILSLAQKALQPLPPPSEDSYLSAKCHCGGVSLLIQRANFTSPDPDINNVGPRYIPTDPTKYQTYLCACRSCRLSSGVSLTPWTLIPADKIFNANANASTSITTGIDTPSDQPDNPSILARHKPSVLARNKLTPIRFGIPIHDSDPHPNLSLKHHQSSPNVYRSFCERCGATICYWSSERPEELDLATGILRPEEGSLGRRWLEWKWGECSFAEECVDAEFCEAWLHCAQVMEGIDQVAES